MSKENIRTYETRLNIDSVIDEGLHAFAELFAHVQHSLFADIASGKESNALKKIISCATRSQRDNSIRQTGMQY